MKNETKEIVIYKFWLNSNEFLDPTFIVLLLWGPPGGVGADNLSVLWFHLSWSVSFSSSFHFGHTGSMVDLCTLDH